MRETADAGIYNVLYMQHFEGERVHAYLAHVLPVELDGLFDKRRESICQPRARTRDWVKIKRPGAAPAE